MYGNPKKGWSIKILGLFQSSAGIYFKYLKLQYLKPKPMKFLIV